MIGSEKNLQDTVLALSQRYNIVGNVDLTGLAAVDWTDLREKLAKVWQQSYDHDQRIIITIDRDWYAEHKGCGALLEGLQRQINDIDISNFFVIVVTSNPDVDSEIQWLQHNISRDPVAISAVSYLGDYHRMAALTVPNFSIDQTSAENLTDRTLNPRHRDLLNTKTFCMAPWTHLYPRMDKKVKPCCITDMDIGDLQQYDLETIWNQAPLRDIRVHMLEDRPHPACQKCYDTEYLGKSSYRNYINQKMSRHVALVDQTRQDGWLSQFNLNYMHFNFNNLCNLTCRICSHHSSSAWHAVAVGTGQISKSTPVLITANDDGKLFQQAQQHLPYVDLIKFTGGEPLMMQEFYDILDLLLEQKRTHVELFYNTNLTVTRYRSRSIFDLWRQFDQVTVGASLDAMGSRAEYIRQGCKWNTIVENRREMMDRCPDVEFFVSATATLLNAWHLPDFHRDWVSQGLIKPQDFDINLLHSPDYLRLHRAPATMKQELKHRYLQHLDWLRPLDTLGRSTHAFEFLLSLLEINEAFDTEGFWSNITAQDRYHDTDLLLTFPELAMLPKHG